MAADDRSSEKPSSPLRSLRSFQSEIPVAMTMEDTTTKHHHAKSFHQHLDHFINSIPLHVTVFVLVTGNCFIVAGELLLSYNMLQNVTDREKILDTLSSCSLGILSIFVLEVVVRIFSTGAHFRRRKFEIFDACVVLLTFVLDLVFYVSNVQTTNPFTRAFSLLIILRLWRSGGILRREKKRIREETACELQMEKYARRQAEAQADALQVQCDQQLKEIAYLRNFLHQNNLDPDTTKLDFLPNYRASASITTSAIEWDKADTLRVNGKLSKDPSLDSIASMSSMKDPASTSSTQNIYSQPPTTISDTPSTPALTTVESHPTTNETKPSLIPSEGQSNEGYMSDEDRGASSRVNMEGGSVNMAFEEDSSPQNGHNESGSRTDSDGGEAQLRIELEEIRRLSEEALQSELSSSNTMEVDGIPTTSL
ncbi:uncharacterized protein LOC117295744 [Asterias rubens]|uniref:uncharacterized protein LOC117295744 n=1 Tax=Asterias rubens TaxID=7604 RepID=UPI001455D5A1|nr:uncharacterized protein LOC117295744 [Asterias rubens]